MHSHAGHGNEKGMSCNVCDCGKSGCPACRGAWLSDRRVELEKMYRWMEDLTLKDQIINRQMRLWDEFV